MAKAISDFTGYPNGKKTYFKKGDPIPSNYTEELADKKPPLISKVKTQSNSDIK